MAEKQLKAMISSTSLDLPEHRNEVRDACLRQGMFPTMMEHLPANDAEAISTSLKMVDEADIYVGVFAHRYGYVPKDRNPKEISVTEMEYDRAVERKIPRLIFVIDKTHPITIDDVEQGEGAIKLRAFLDRVKIENIVNFFKSPEDLRAHVINSLSQKRTPDLEKFHHVSEIPVSPEMYVAHPYTLLQTHGLVGRQEELNLLTDWVASPESNIYKAHILSIVAIGGMGKSALTWKWFNDIAPEEMKPLAGRMWWSFYESDATFENFIIRSLAYVSKRSIEEIQKVDSQDKEVQLLAILDKEPFLFVLDGLERILIAYARMDAAHLSDDDYDRQTANFVANAYGLPASANQSFIGEHRLRKTADPRAGVFLRKLSNINTARILISTRLYPADLQMVTGEAIGNTSALFLPGLSDDDALNLWRAYKVSGSTENLLPIFNRVERHPLLIQSLAGEVSRDREHPGDFDSWKIKHPTFDPFTLPLKQVKSHVLSFALSGLDEKARQVLHTIAAFRMPGQYDTLVSLLTGEGKACENEPELDAALTELEDRGLVGWDKRANRYDLHPIVRGVVWSGLDSQGKEGVYTRLHSHFDAVPMIADYLEVNSLEDLTPAIEMYHTLIGMGRYDDAGRFFYERLEKATHLRLGASRQRAEMLEMLFPDGTDNLPRRDRPDGQGFALSALAQAYQFSGRPGRAAPLYHRYIDISLENEDDKNLAIGMNSLSDTLRVTGYLRESDLSAGRSLEITRRLEDRFLEAISLQLLGSSLAARGEAGESEQALRRSLRMFVEQDSGQGQGRVRGYLGERAIWFGKYVEALDLAGRAWELANIAKFERDFVRAARVQGEAALALNKFEVADERLHHALIRARAINHVEEELPALVALSELNRGRGDEKVAREFLNDVWEYAERGPYPLFHADALNVLAQIERDSGNTKEAIEAATKAYELAWCDGPPYAYHWGLIKAQRHLEELGAPLPEMLPFDESKFEPMPEVEINPKDEFHVGDLEE